MSTRPERSHFAAHAAPTERGPAWSLGYFSRNGTVERWWDPVGESDEAARAWFLDQLDGIIELGSFDGSRVLDAATGRGRAAVAVALAGAAEVVGVDISDEMLEVARQNVAEAGVAEVVRLERGNVSALRFPDSSFDRVLLLEVLLHFDDPEAVLHELARVLEPGGRIILTTNGSNPLSRLAQPGRKGPRPATRVTLAAVTAANEVMTALFGFGWRRTSVTRRLYDAVFAVPVRPLYPWQVRAMLRRAGFVDIKRLSLPNRFVVREHRWVARKPAS